MTRVSSGDPTFRSPCKLLAAALAAGLTLGGCAALGEDDDTAQRTPRTTTAEPGTDPVPARAQGPDGGSPESTAEPATDAEPATEDGAASGAGLEVVPDVV